MVVGRGVDDSETFNCIKEMFGRINRDNLLQVLRNSEKKYEVTVPPANLKGYEQILQIIGKSSSKSVREDAAAFLCMLYINYQGEGVNRYQQPVLPTVRQSYRQGQRRLCSQTVLVTAGPLHHTVGNDE
jgi:hypothetical protein